MWPAIISLVTLLITEGIRLWGTPDETVKTQLLAAITIPVGDAEKLLAEIDAAMRVDRAAATTTKMVIP
jgi:hypothetical protein